MTQIAQAVAEAKRRPEPRRAHVSAAVRWLRQSGLLITAEANAGGSGNDYRLCASAVPRSTPRQRPIAPVHPHLEAFDRRAVGWSLERRKVWRCVWRAFLAAATSDGRVMADVAALTDRASDLLRRDIADETVAKVLTWSVMTRLTIVVRHGSPSVYQIVPADPIGQADPADADRCGMAGDVIVADLGATTGRPR